jgi:threonine dehydratase
MRFTASEVEHAQHVVYSVMPPTPQYAWPLLQSRFGCPVWIKHENHTPAGSFKLRGGLVYFEELSRRHRSLPGVICATRGNFGQSVGWGARRYDTPASVVVPHGNSIEKNAAMRALGMELIAHGDDFQAASEYADLLARERGLYRVPSFHRSLVQGVMTYWLEFFENFKRGAGPAVIYVPIGLGSGFCAAAAARAYAGVTCAIVGVVSAHATTYLDSFREGRVVAAQVATRLADGMACRIADEEALQIILREAEDVVAVTDEEVADAMRILFSDTHNVAEGGGAAGLAAAIKTRVRWASKSVGIPLTGGNVDIELFARILGGHAH